MSDASKTEARGALLGSDGYLALLAIVLLGYALMGKGFAYLGVPPLFVGEIALLTGAVVFLRTGALVASLATLPSLMLVAMMVWVLARTIPFVSVYGFDSLRDSTVVMYGCFALIVIGLLLEDARRIDTVLRYYNTLPASLPAILVGFCLTLYWGEYIPSLYGSMPIMEITTSAVGTHLVGTMVFVLIGYRKVSLLWFSVWLTALAIVAATNRGATLSVLGPLVFAMLMLGRLRLLATAMLAVVGIFVVLLTVESSFTQDNVAKPLSTRVVSAHQIIRNAESVLGDSGDQNVEGTKRWRLNWWEIIINDTIYGPNFWTGRGFGLNLADADGHQAGPVGSAPTRSPHNVNMTMLARAGVPGLVLWLLLLISWGGMMLRAMLVARARGHKQWADLFLFVICYVISILINAFVDVTLEGPMQGIWFWCLFGFGIGSAMVYRAQAADGIGSPRR
jgi:O-antigen ligase/polysaccharide polymerase Wzy-like membrane protein